MNLENIAKDNTIFKAITGSMLYGTNTPSSDRDEVGIFIPPKDFVIGTIRVEQIELRTNIISSSGKRNSKEDTDCVIYALPKFFELLTNNNPNIVELLFIPDKCLLKRSKYYDEIVKNKDIFLSLKTKHTFLGYAYAQKNKILAKKKTYEKYFNFLAEGYSKEKAMSMLDDSIGGRIEYYEKFGYDVKFASHLIRLLHEGLEILREGTIYLPLHQNNLILDIKEGKYTLEEVLKMADDLEKYVTDAYVKSPLRHTPDKEAINKLQIKLLEEYWDEKEI